MSSSIPVVSNREFISKVSRVESGAGGNSRPEAAAGGGEGEEPGVKPVAGSVPVFASELGDPEKAWVRLGSVLGMLEDENIFVEVTSKEGEGSTPSLDRVLGRPPPTAIC